MKVLFDHSNPFVLAHGGFQIQIEQIYAAVRQIGLEVEYLRWWDDSQHGDIIHYFGRPTSSYLSAVRQKGMKLVLNELLTGLGSRGAWALRCQRNLMQLGRAMMPGLESRLGWDAFRRADACVANTTWEAHLMHFIYGAAKEQIHLVPNGVEDVFLNSPAAPRGQWLICAATITERKRIVELAEAAIAASVPVWVIGKPYSQADPYFQRFVSLANQARQWVRYEGPIEDRPALARAYREARGFVLLSNRETLSLSAGEAAACECPLLLSDLPWARAAFGPEAWYCPVAATTTTTAESLRRFYEAAPGIRPPTKPPTWREIAQRFKALYERVLNNSR